MTTNPNQAAFTAAYLGLAAKGFERSYDAKHGCLYRGPRGLKCAVGHLIPDEHYDPTWELGCDPTITNRPAIQTLLDTIYPGVSIPMLSRLQEAHDSFRTPEKMQAALADVATYFELELPHVS